MKKQFLYTLSFLIFLVACKKEEENKIAFVDDDFRTNCIKPVDKPKVADWEVTELKTLEGRIYDLFFTDQQTGYAIGNNAIRKTSDGGQQWKSVLNKSSVGNFNTLFFLNPQIGWATSDHPENCVNTQCDVKPTLWKTTDAGATWKASEPKIEGIISDLYMTDEQNGFCLSGSAKTKLRLLKTQDGGLNWEAVPNLELNSTNFKLYFANKDVGYIPGTNGILYKTTTAGATWQVLTTNLKEIYQVVLLDAQTLFISDGNTLLSTKNAGDNWEQVVKEDLTFRLVHFPNTEEGIAFFTSLLICDDGTKNYLSNLSSTENGGRTWRTEKFGFDPYDLVVFAPTPDVCYLAYNNGLLRFTKQ